MKKADFAELFKAYKDCVAAYKDCIAACKDCIAGRFSNTGCVPLMQSVIPEANVTTVRVNEKKMCQFFSLTSDGEENIAYFNWEQRKKIMNGEIEGQYHLDSHMSINNYYEFRGAAEDKRNNYEYNPLTGQFTVDMINTTDDSKAVEAKVRNLDFKTIVEPLIIKPFIHPFRLPKVEAVTEYHISLLRQWDSVWYLVRYSVRSSAIDSFGYSVMESVRDLVRESGIDSIEYSVWAYISSFFNIEKWRYIDHEPYVNPFQCCIDLWEAGLVPSYDGKIWRLHSGEKADVVWQGKI